MTPFRQGFGDGIGLGCLVAILGFLALKLLVWAMGAEG